MAQLKAIFIGRPSADNGLLAYRQLAKFKNIHLTEYINTPNASKYLHGFDYAFVSRYLVILEALAVGIPVVAHFNNAIKYDYLAQAPFAKFIKIFRDPNSVDLHFDSRVIKLGQNWAKRQTWDKVADLYEKLWQK